MWAFGLATFVLDRFQVQDPVRIDPHRSQNHRAEPMLVSSMLLGSMDAQLSHVDCSVLHLVHHRDKGAVGVVVLLPRIDQKLQCFWTPVGCELL